MKKVCNGYVTEQEFSKVKALIINKFLCNGYVTEHLKILFDWETASTTKKVVKPLYSCYSLFDGYLTEH